MKEQIHYELIMNIFLGWKFCYKACFRINKYFLEVVVLFFSY